MTDFILPLKPKIVKEENNQGVYEIEGFYPGYGMTIGNALRRVLLSSMPGAAITTIKIKGVQHEFSTIPGIMEDVIQVILNLKKIRVKMYSVEPQTLSFSIKGERKVTAADFEKNSNVDIIDPNIYIATLTDKKAELEVMITVEPGLGFVPLEVRKKEKLPIGTISVDALFSPIEKVNCEVTDMRVGDRTDYNRLVITIETDGSISPQVALKKSAEILSNHFQLIDSGLEVEKEKESVVSEKVEKKSKKSEKKIKTKK